jgi:hypothetical protein
MPRMTGDDFRRLALALHGASEGAHMKHPDFRAAGRIFASLDAGEQRGMAKLSPDEQRELLREYPDVFYPAAGAWGRQGCTMIDLAAADEAAVRGALSLAWEGVVARKAPAKKAPVKKEKKRAAKKKTY